MRLSSTVTALCALLLIVGPREAPPDAAAQARSHEKPGSGGRPEARVVATDSATVRVEPGECGWTDRFWVPNLENHADALAVYDDGGGAALYVAGRFATADRVTVNHIARWDGTTWSALAGPAGAGTSDDIRALAVYDDGTGPALYAGGEFVTAGGVTVNYIARWNGTTWSALAGPSSIGTDGGVHALAVHDDGTGPALYVGGWFLTAGGVTVNKVARWDGTSWSALSGPAGTGMTGYAAVTALTSFDHGGGPALYAGGQFETAGGVATSNIARWDGAAWSALTGPSGNGTNGAVEGLGVFDDGSGPGLYVGGNFSTAGGLTVNNVARWDGTAWSPLTGPSGTGTDNRVAVFAVFDDGTGPALYAGGIFSHAGGLAISMIARWDGITWSPVSGAGGTGVDYFAKGLAVFDDGSGSALYAAGWFGAAGGLAVNGIARWDGIAWSPLSAAAGTGIRGYVNVMKALGDGPGGPVCAGGSFDTAGGVALNNVGTWDGTGWAPLSGPAGIGTDGDVFALTLVDEGSHVAVYAGGSFTTAGGVTVNRVARWNGSGWSALSGPSGTGTGGSSPNVYALEVFDDGSGPALYAGGGFLTAGGVTVSNVARWNGSGWSALSGPSGTGVGSYVFALKVFDDGSGPALYVGGLLGVAGGVTANRIARWDGSNWSSLIGPTGNGTDSGIYALEVFDDGTGPALYAGGWFTTAGGVTVNRIARWDGTAWSALAGPSGIGMNGGVEALAVLDDGTGPALYAGGWFTTAGGVRVDRVARWDGTAWSAIEGPTGPGVDGDVWALAGAESPFERTLYVGGNLALAGGVPSVRIATWRCPGPAIFIDGFESGDTTEWSAATP